MATSDYKNCTDCGASFRKSRTDYTVRCPRCRKGVTAKTICNCDITIPRDGRPCINCREAGVTLKEALGG